MKNFLRQLILFVLTFGVNQLVFSQNQNGHEYIDLGLPSGTLWATCNVGANTPEEVGDLYAWGEIETKETYSWDTYKWCTSKPSSTNYSITKYCDRNSYGVIDGKVALEPTDDVARIKWGGSWHIPTDTEIQELLDNCTFEWVKIDNVRGYKFTGSNGNNIFMPSVNGSFEYWSSSLRQNARGTNANEFWGGSSSLEVSGSQRCYGLPVRPVISKMKTIVYNEIAPSSHQNHDLVDLGLPSGTLWATCNVGAISPENYGCYYAWGEIIGSCDGKNSFYDGNYIHYNGDNVVKYNFTDSLTDLEACDDVAFSKWEGEWRIPTWSEMQELRNSKYTTWEWTSESGIYGLRVTSIVKGFEGKSIFLPAGGEHDKSKVFRLGEYGHYWSSRLDTSSDFPTNACYLFFKSTGWGNGYTSRSAGRNIRPVVSIRRINKVIITEVPDGPIYNNDYILGDANGDGKVTVADYTAIAHYIMGNAPDNFNEKAADVNGDGKINVADYTAAAHLILYGTVEKPK